ncbi:MAG: hypothetical protein J6S67_22440 [Methanobrevibacter sp.]|nr:hypothetical protein [Methanobrevibacter sp.]
MANTNAASKWYVCATPQNNNLTQSDYESLIWTLISKVGNVGETGKSTNVLTYNTWDTEVADKAKGITDAGSPTIECAREPDDAGQEILRAAAAVGNNNKYAFKEVRADGPLGGTGTIFYNRGIVAGPTRPNGGNEDFDLEVFTLGLVQEEIIVKPTSAGNPPVLTAAPAISGTAQVGETLTCSNGTFTGDATITYTYQWFANGVAVQGATANTVTLVADDVGKIFMCRVTARNAAGYAFGFSNTTSAVTAE